ncbi:MAG: M16 family metallopeptidase [Mangrovibacterium sp.]
MKFLKYLLSIILFTFLFTSYLPGQSTGYVVKTGKDANGDVYQYVTNDPMKTRIYTFSNGLKVYITPSDADSRIQTMIGVRAGSAVEPVESTGLAHYLEHMLFKGTDRIGTVNWEAEQPLLEQISDLYEQHRATPDEQKKKIIYAKIDSLSSIAARYAAPNEFSKLATVIGAEKVNATTSLDFTYYRENIPSNELERWVRLESERMSKVVLRLFHTELETVYEEYNRAQDSEARQIFYTMLGELFKKHPYQRPTIGDPFDLKNPSMVNIHKYFNTWYVPNNMFIVLSGYVNPELTIPLLKRYFGNWQKKELPKVDFPKEDPITKPRVNEVFSKEEEKMVLAYRFDGKNSADYPYVIIIDKLLSNNGKTGLFDINLNQNRKVHSASSSPMFFKDYGIHYFSGVPKEDQSLEEVQTLIRGELEKIKRGEFGEWLLEAIINSIKLERISLLENNISMATSILYSEVYGVPYEKYVAFPSELSKITKKDVISFANRHYNDNYTVIYKRMGEKKLHQVEKPAITPLHLDNTNQSDFATRFMQGETENLKPEFVDYQKEFPGTKLKNGMDFYYQKETNGLFSLRYIIPVGKDHDNLLPFAAQYFRELGTSRFSPDSLKKELFRYGIAFDVSAASDKTYINVRGLDEHFDKAMELVEDLFADVQNDPEIYHKLIGKEEGNRKLLKNNQRAITAYGRQYVLFGANNFFRNNPSIQQLKEEDPARMLEKINRLFDYNHIIYYSGNKSESEVIKKITSRHKLPATFAVIPPQKEYSYLPAGEPTVYLLDYDIVQAQINAVVNDDVQYSPNLLAYQELYNRYYGSGLGSIIFQEIREARALAYSSGSFYQMEVTSDEKNAVIGYVGTQANKLPEATLALNSLMENMKYDAVKFEYARNSLIKSLESERIPRKYYFGKYMGLQRNGINYDVRKTMYEDLKEMTPDKFREFFSGHINHPVKQYFILTRKQDIDLESLKQFGTIKEITLEDIFGF